MLCSRAYGGSCCSTSPVQTSLCLRAALTLLRSFYIYHHSTTRASPLCGLWRLLRPIQTSRIIRVYYKELQHPCAASDRTIGASDGGALFVEVEYSAFQLVPVGLFMTASSVWVTEDTQGAPTISVLMPFSRISSGVICFPLIRTDSCSQAGKMREKCVISPKIVSQLLLM